MKEGQSKERWETYPIPVEVDSSAADITDGNVTWSKLLIAHPNAIYATLEDEIREETTTAVLHPHALGLAPWEWFEVNVGDGCGLSNLKYELISKFLYF